MATAPATPDQAWKALIQRAQPQSLDVIAGPVLVLVPHADDETLGCGGILAALFEREEQVELILVTDGTGSHPNAASFSAEARRQIREDEFKLALQKLGGSKANVRFWRKLDAKLPELDESAHTQAIYQLTDCINAGDFKTILTPWRRDPHGDHQVVTQWVFDAVKQARNHPQILEYFVWTGHQGKLSAFPQELETLDVLEVDVLPQAEKVQAALQAHQSQLGNVFDDPSGFTLPAHLAQVVHRTREYYVRTRFSDAAEEHQDARHTQTLSHSYFNKIYADKVDPWGFATRQYEKDKYEDTVRALTKQVYPRGFEVGCSIGILTQQLAARCKTLISSEINAKALAEARRRNAHLANVHFCSMMFPRQQPAGTFDLIILSEVAYYWSEKEFAFAQSCILKLLEPQGQLLLVHYTPTETDYPLTGDQVHEKYLALTTEASPVLRHVSGHRREQYRLDLFEKVEARRSGGE